MLAILLGAMQSAVPPSPTTHLAASVPQHCSLAKSTAWRMKSAVSWQCGSATSCSTPPQFSSRVCACSGVKPASKGPARQQQQAAHSKARQHKEVAQSTHCSNVSPKHFTLRYTR